MTDRRWNTLSEALASMKLTIVCLVLLMILVVICTLAQVPLGTHLAVERTIRTLIIWSPADWGLRVPLFPGGGLVGLVLLANLLFAQFLRLERSRRKAGLWLAHLGLALLFVGEFATSVYQVDSRLPIQVGQTRSYTEDYRKMELAVVDGTDPKEDVATSIPESLLSEGRVLETPALPFKIVVKRYYENAELGRRETSDGPSEATAGIGPSLLVRPAAPATSDDAQNAAAALVELRTSERSLGTYWVSNALGAPQGFALDGRSWRLALRSRRYYLPFSLTLKEFRHDVYPGTDIPKNFSSLVHLSDPAAGEDRDALIRMNSPLRYGGKTFYQASFGMNDRLSVLQVVRNPGWLIPYFSCAAVALGMLLHFGVKLAGALKVRS